MVKIRRENITIGNVSVLYDGDKTQIDSIKKNNFLYTLYMAIYCIAVLFLIVRGAMLIDKVGYTWAAYVWEIVGIIVFIFVLPVFIFSSGALGYSKSFWFIKHLLSINDICAEWFDGELLIKTYYKDGARKFYNISEFINNVETPNKTLEDESVRVNPIQVIIDVTDEDICAIVVKSVEKQGVSL